MNELFKQALLAQAERASPQVSEALRRLAQGDKGALIENWGSSAYDECTRRFAAALIAAVPHVEPWQGDGEAKDTTGRRLVACVGEDAFVENAYGQACTFSEYYDANDFERAVAFAHPDIPRSTIFYSKKRGLSP